MKVETIRNFRDAKLLRLKKAQLLITLQFEANFSFSDFNLSKKLLYATSSYQVHEHSCNSPIPHCGNENSYNFCHSFSKLQMDYGYLLAL